MRRDGAMKRTIWIATLALLVPTLAYAGAERA